jgi:3-hydroxyisobutyrate dehydrogenase-like beta-hydroxyacid dehydrogenase
MAKLGFLGLGLMGYPMARNLLRAGHEVALWSNTAEKARKLAAEKGPLLRYTPAGGGKCGLHLSSAWATPQMAREVILGADGIVQGARPGTVVADASTISPSESRKIGQALKPRASIFSTLPAPDRLRAPPAAP